MVTAFCFSGLKTYRALTHGVNLNKEEYISQHFVTFTSISLFFLTYGRSGPEINNHKIYKNKKGTDKFPLFQHSVELQGVFSTRLRIKNLWVLTTPTTGVFPDSTAFSRIHSNLSFSQLCVFAWPLSELVPVASVCMCSCT